MFLEIVGYIGSALVVISMLMTSVVKLRIVNMIGSVVSGTYAFIIGSFPLALMNVCLIIINIFNLVKLLKTKQQYDFIECSLNDSFLKYFLIKYEEDIKKYFANFDNEKEKADIAYAVVVDGKPAGLTLGKKVKEDTVDIVIDYSIPTYRDCSIGKYLYSKLPNVGLKYLTFRKGKSYAHESYLEKVGFKLKDEMYVKEL